MNMNHDLGALVKTEFVCVERRKAEKEIESDYVIECLLKAVCVRARWPHPINRFVHSLFRTERFRHMTDQ